MKRPIPANQPRKHEDSRHQPSACWPDLAAAICEAWLARHGEHERLIHSWQALETELFHRPDWRRLTEHERARLPQVAEMEALNARINDLFDHNRKDLARLSSLTATTATGLLQKLRVAAALVAPDENEEAHALLQSILHDAGAGALAGPEEATRR